MATTKAVTPLGFALLGLCIAEPRSGYALRKVFETTPLGSYSSSPGSIYPALKALQTAGLVEQRPADAGKSVFAATAAGKLRFDSWLTAPVEPDDLARNLDTALLRFAFLQWHSDPRASLDFLASLEAGAWAQARSLEAYLDGEEAHNLSLQSRLAVEHGLETIRCSARWAASARRRLEHALRWRTEDEE
jgi:DNA-binding PadR family transcriptional regulator